jgi:hypothetical protein
MERQRESASERETDRERKRYKERKRERESGITCKGGGHRRAEGATFAQIAAEYFGLPPCCNGLQKIVPCHLSACLTLGLLLSRTLLTPNLARSPLHGHSSSLQHSFNRAATELQRTLQPACCTGTAHRSQTPHVICHLISRQGTRNSDILYT